MRENENDPRLARTYSLGVVVLVIQVELGGDGNGTTLVGPQEEVEGGPTALGLEDPLTVRVETAHPTERRDHHTEG